MDIEDETQKDYDEKLNDLLMVVEDMTGDYLGYCDVCHKVGGHYETCCIGGLERAYGAFVLASQNYYLQRLHR